MDGTAGPGGGRAAALRVPGVARFVVARTASALGGEMLAVAVGWQIYDRTDSFLALGLVGLVQVVPVVALALFAGRIVDRNNRRSVAIAAAGGHALAALALFLVVRASAPLPFVYACLVGVGVASAFLSPATSALFAQIVPREHLAEANAWRSSAFQLAATGGPALAGWLIARLGSAVLVFALDAILVGLFAVVLLTLRAPPPPPRVEAPAGGADVRAGIAFVFRTKLLLAAITLDLFAVLLAGTTALLPAFARDRLHVDAGGLGWLRAAPSIGALVMALVQTRLPPWRRAGRTLLVVVAGFGVATVVFALSRDFRLSFAMLLLAGALDNVSVVIRATLEQLVVPEHLRGRVAAVHYVFIGLSNQMGAFESGLAAWALGLVPSVVAGGVASLVVVGLVAWRWPELRRLGRLGDVRVAE